MLAVRGLCKSFGDKRVLDGVDLDLAEGESLVVIGGSGTGKSVLLRCILGLEQPDAGQILWQGRPLAEQRDRFMAGFGMLFQNAALFDSLPVWRNVAFRLLRTMPRAQARALAIEKLARVGLGPEVADLYPAALSGGMRKRAGLARAIAADPRVIFFDEPTTGLDPIRAATINDMIRGIVDETGATAITITHDMSSVRTIADRVALLDQGRLRWQGDLAAMATAQDDYLADFVAGRARPMARAPG
ncbi:MULTISPECIES: ABC transporter ATP-binding protein [unclassified Paracoccus (in: a-proteobacteria)]|uniref:ABC transporter ATP-binding protein n=1 Tax=unclassified Paracoccus (in: a-proteobacteria) TaxID=2688777 RepID=UPI0012B41FB2|nr:MULTISPECIES: ATP-binding cassette domain-containing protein [unclassified Paracoccus (in: a-proteobacteria)]UXU74250.1 ATP-binding cassette domain-containing protein [Paracoccus sp. SMMA_5]UXU80140.1 ATP-binding cassette domain-containing protein [Paracoccus sp. SMMA_5_TC]